MFLPECYVFDIGLPFTSSLMAVMTYSSLFLTLNWNACWINQKCRQHSANFWVYNEGDFSFLKPEAKLNSVKARREAHSEGARETLGRIWVVWKPISLIN